MYYGKLLRQIGEALAAIKELLNKGITEIGGKIEAAASQYESDKAKEKPAPIINALVTRPQIEVEEKRAQKADEKAHRDRAELRDQRRLKFEGYALIFGAMVALANIALFMETCQSVQVASTAADAAKAGAKASEDQVKATKESIDQTVSSFKKEQRAWVSATLDNPGGVQDGRPLITVENFINTGKTPATKVRTCQVSKIVLRTNKRLDINCPESRLSPGFSVILPNGTTQRLANAAGADNIPPLTPDGLLTPTLHEDLRSGKRVAITYGSVEYEDVFGIHHWTKLCSILMIMPATPGGLPETNNWSQCEIGNDIDTNYE
jgi:hypothetical protein